MAHLGNRVSALLDGRLSAAEEERCWDHVHQCHSCRDLVEREGWVKTSLAQLSWGPGGVPESLKLSLRDQPSVLMPPAFPTATRPALSRGLALIGGGAAGACVVGVLALGLMGPSRVEPRPPTVDLSRPVGPIAPVAPVAPSRTEVPTEQRRTAPSTVSRAPRTGRVALVHEKMTP
jgi:anti-sigma factor RsiW